MKEQIEEMRDDISQIEKDVKNQCKDRKCKECHLFFADIDCYIHRMSEALYNAGYRKQSEGEWIKHTASYECTVCKNEFFVEGYAEDYDPITDWDLHFCPNCGAKMKGGAE